MAVDPKTHRLFVGGGPALVMVDDANGKVLADVKICAGTDATWFDPTTNNVFVSCSDGHITVAHEDGPDKLSVVQTIDTARGARTMAFDPASHRIYVAAQNYAAPDPNAAPPAGGRGRGPAPIPESLHVFVFGTK
jgi:DNA-binding beta-propeller fold protein YncE